MSEHIIPYQGDRCVDCGKPLSELYIKGEATPCVPVPLPVEDGAVTAARVEAVVQAESKAMAEVDFDPVVDDPLTVDDTVKPVERGGVRLDG
jgi:hypothetical protein